MKLDLPPAPRKPRAKAASSVKQRWQGELQGSHRGLIYGWALDSEQPNQRVVLEVIRDGEPIGTLTADVARSDLAERFAACAAGHVLHDICHGFVADVGLLKKDHEGIVTVRVANTGTYLPGHVELETDNKPPIAATSGVLSDGALRLHGWAIDTMDETRTVTVRAYLDGQLLAEAPANLTHPALRSHEVGQHGFTLDLPPSLGDGRSHSVRVVDEKGNALNGSPLTVCCYAAGAKSLLPDGLEEVVALAIDGYERILPRSLGMQHYPAWRAQFEQPAASARAGQQAALTTAVVINGSDPTRLERTLASLRQQTQPALRVFFADGSSANMTGYADQVQAALASGCDVVTLLRAGDTLVPHALETALEGFASPASQLVYTDSERAGRPWFKPAWNPEYALASDYPLDFLLARTDAVAALPHAATGDAARLAWSLLAARWSDAQQSVVHVPRVLLHNGEPLSQDEQQARHAAAAAALATVEPKAKLQLESGPADASFQPRRVLRPLDKRARQTKVSLIIPTRDRVELLERCITSIQAHTAWDNLEIIVVDNDSALPKTKAYFRKIAKQGVKVLASPGPFNFATLNNEAVAAASGDVIGLINNDIEATHAGWLDEIISHLLRPGVGAVGAKLLWPNGMVQHGGVLLGVGNVAGHFGNRLADADWGDHGRNQLLQQVSGVTAACLFLRKRDYVAIGGMDGTAFPVAFNDVDLCLKIRQTGLAIIWTPYAKMLHAESASRGHEDTPQKRVRALREIDLFRARWGSVIVRDPAYHPSLNLDAYSNAFGGLALPPRSRAPRLAGLALPDAQD